MWRRWRVHCRKSVGRYGVTVGFEIDLYARQSLYQNKQRNNKLSVLLQYHEYIIITVYTMIIIILCTM